jgi:hypothetical protein
MSEAKTFVDPDRVASLRTEYAEVNNNFRMLADIRFKLLALVPALGGAANFVLSGFALAQGAPSPPYSLVFIIGVMGFLTTLGITLYDQRNSELYNGLISRAKYLEEILALPQTGQFRERPRRGRRLFGLLPMGHDIGLSMIYGPVLGAWAFPVTLAVLMRLRFGDNPRIVALIVAILMSMAFTLELLRHDRSLPWQKDSHEGQIVAFDRDRRSLTLSHQVRDLRRDNFIGEMTEACSDRFWKLMSNNSIVDVRGRRFKVWYVETKTMTAGFIDTRYLITKVSFQGEERDHKQTS